MPLAALTATLFFVAYLLKRLGRFEVTSWALMLPTLWLLILTSRPVSFWIDPPFVTVTLDTMPEGSLLDRSIIVALEVCAFLVVLKRHERLQGFLGANKALLIFLLFAGLSIAWSDFSGISLKRYIKVVGHLLMAMVVFSEADPFQALGAVIRRCAVVHLPLSIVLIKYFADLGRRWSPWGEQMYTGVTLGKNDLGALLFIVLVYLAWSLLLGRESDTEQDKEPRWPLIVLFGMGVWLMLLANSATALLCAILAVSSMWLFSRPSLLRNPKKIKVIIILAGLFLVAGELFFSLSGMVVSLTGREATFVGRQELWDDALRLATNPWIGTGFESFWLGRRADLLAEERWWSPNQAHNGYIETYLNLGLIGLTLLLGAVYSAYRRSWRKVSEGRSIGILLMGYVIGIAFYNITEARLHGLTAVWYLFFLVSVQVSKPRDQAVGLLPRPGSGARQTMVPTSGVPELRNQDPVSFRRGWLHRSANG